MPRVVTCHHGRPSGRVACDRASNRLPAVSHIVQSGYGLSVSSASVTSGPGAGGRGWGKGSRGVSGRGIIGYWMLDRDSGAIRNNRLRGSLVLPRNTVPELCEARRSTLPNTASGDFPASMFPQVKGFRCAFTRKIFDLQRSSRIQIQVSRY
jgi:hypothetical protein